MKTKLVYDLFLMIQKAFPIPVSLSCKSETGTHNCSSLDIQKSVCRAIRITSMDYLLSKMTVDLFQTMSVQGKILF